MEWRLGPRRGLRVSESAVYRIYVTLTEAVIILAVMGTVPIWSAMGYSSGRVKVEIPVTVRVLGFIGRSSLRLEVQTLSMFPTGVYQNSIELGSSGFIWVFQGAVRNENAGVSH